MDMAWHGMAWHGIIIQGSNAGYQSGKAGLIACYEALQVRGNTIPTAFKFTLERGL